MGIFSRNKKKEPVPQVEERGLGLLFNAGTSYGASMAMKLSSIYCATNQISNSVAMLPINIVKYDTFEKKQINHPLWQVLNLKPDNIHTSFIFFKQLIESVILKGNGYAYIERDEQLNVKKLTYINPDYVTVLPQADGTRKYLIVGMGAAVDDINMIHLYMHCDENGNGISLVKYASDTINSNASAEKQASGYFSNGGSLNGVLKAKSTLTREQKSQIRESWNEAFKGDSTGVAILPQGLDYQPISMNASDLQLLDSRAFGIIEIARWFCIPPSKLMVWEDTSYNSLEYSQLIYLTDTIQPYISMIKAEFDLKLFKPSQVGKIGIEFDFASLLVTDKASEIKYYGDCIKNGIMSPNEVRVKLGLEKISAEVGGDDYFMQLSYSTLKNISSGVLVKGQEQGQNQNVDNQAKIDEEE